MIFKDWTYRKKNKALVLLGILLLAVSWPLAFGKTYALLRDYRQLRNRLATGNVGNANKPILLEKKALQDSLLLPYTTDSTVWVSGLLSQVGTRLSTSPVGVSFDNKPVGSNFRTVERELVLSGSFSQLQQALSALEKDFFVKSVQAYVEKEQLKYRVRLAAVKGKDRVR